ncbi:MAG: hypothetical protein IJG83_07230 [Thermoguttaceae bacterium]|nr:hypothetical protein [Thermoguttaceae bacterium]
MRLASFLLSAAALTAGLLCASARGEDAKTDVPEPILSRAGLIEKPDQMVYRVMINGLDQAKAAWEENFKKLIPDGDLAGYQTARREYFWKNLGELWDKTPLNPQVTGTMTGEDGVRIEKIVLETLPHFYATGTMFLPDESKYPPPYPGVLVVCGHSFEGKACELYQGIARLGAEHGLAMYVQDPIDQGERMQHIGDDGKPYLSSVAAHNVVGATSSLLGRNAATFEVWDMTRALDYLQSRPDIIPDKLGVAGNSGGGTQTSYIMSLDDRVAVATPSCYICSLYGHLTHQSNPQDAEQNIFGQAAFGMDHIDYVLMRAPKPTLLCTKTNDFFNVADTWVGYRAAKRIYSQLRRAENLDIIENYGDHGYCPENLEASIRWFVRHFTGRVEDVSCPFVPSFGKDVPPDTPTLPLVSIDDIRSTANGVLGLPEARTTYDINRDLNAELRRRRAEKFANRSAGELGADVRSLAGIPAWEEITAAKKVDAPENSDGDMILSSEEGIWLPLRAKGLDTADKAKAIKLIVTENGRASEAVHRLFGIFADGPAACVEARGWGESKNSGPQYYQYKWFGTDGVAFYYAYLLGKSYVGMRAFDVLATARYLEETTGRPVELVADGPSSAIVALHAAAASGRFAPVTVPQEIPTWSERVDQAPAPVVLTDFIHGVLHSYDIDDLLRAVETKPLP